MREARAGDRYLLCSDGLSGVVSEETLADALANPDPHATADRLIELALRSGGPDNITVIVADVVEDGGRGTSPMEPVVDGAAGNNAGQRDVDPRSAAGRAALAGPQQQSQPPTAGFPASGPPGRRRRPLRTALVALAAVVVLGAAAAAVYAYVLGQYFVGVQDGADGSQEVAVFRGVNASLVGLDLYTLHEATNLQLTDLQPAARSRVRDGITADTPTDAENIVGRLRDQQLPLCSDLEAAAASSAAASASASAASASAASPTPVPPADGSPTPAPPGVPALSSSPTTAAPTTSARPTRTFEPGVDCREAG
jgi:protein phosphatase